MLRHCSAEQRLLGACRALAALPAARSARPLPQGCPLLGSRRHARWRHMRCSWVHPRGDCHGHQGRLLHVGSRHCAACVRMLAVLALLAGLSRLGPRGWSWMHDGPI